MKDRRDLDFGSLTFKDVAEEEEERGVVFPENADTDERLEDTIIPATGNLTDMMAGDYSGEDEDGFDIFVHHGEEKKMRMRPKSKEERGKFIKKTSFAATVRNKRGCITGVSD